MVRYGVMRHDCRRTDHNDLMCILFVYFRSGNMKMILQLGNNAFYYHPFFFQTVNPWRMQSECHCCNNHSCLHTSNPPVFISASVTRATLIQRNMDNACKSKGFSTLVISFLLV